MTETPRRELLHRTWELELLVSGAVVIGLFQLPGIVDDLFARAVPHLSRELFILPFLVYYFSKAAIYALTGAFMIHLLLRGFWVGLIGLRSAFPEGIHWDRLKIGPVMRETQQQEIVGIDTIEPKVDRAASTLFSVLFALLAILAVVALYCGVSMVAAVVLARLGVGGMSASSLFAIIYYCLLGVIVLPMTFLGLLDRWLAKTGRTPKGAWFARAVQLSFRIFKAGFLAFLWMPIIHVLITNMTADGRKAGWRQSTVVGLIVMLPFAAFFASELGPRLGARMHSYVYFPTGQHPDAHDPDLYETSRDPNDPPAGPVISAEVATGPYLRLFLPYRPRTDNPVLAELCPDVRPFFADGTLAPREIPEEAPTTSDQTLACFGKLYSVALDGEPLAPEYLFSRHRTTGVRGLLTQIRIDHLAPGRHQLVVTKIRSVTGDDDEEPEEPKVTWLPFWR